jgi:hypothetical protein
MPFHQNLTPHLMTYAELKSAADRLTASQVDAQLRSLAAQPQFPALIAWLDRYGDSWADTMTNQALAKDHGKLAHAAGSTYALRILQQSLRNIIEKPAKPPRSALEDSRE